MATTKLCTYTGTDALLQMRDIILRYIPGVLELWAISCCCKDLRNHYANTIYVKYILERNLRGLLRSFGLTMTNLQCILRVQRGSVLSGSAVLQAYTGAFWETSDMDIYIPYKAHRFKAVLNGLMHVIPNCEFATIIPHNKAYLNMSDHAAIVEVERPNAKKLQFIFVTNFVNSANVGANVVKGFDLTIVQNFYDGNNNFRAKYFKHILNREMELSPHCPNELGYRNILRIKKYEQRGYKFIKTFKPENICPLAWLYINDIYKTRTGNQVLLIEMFGTKFKFNTDEENAAVQAGQAVQAAISPDYYDRKHFFIINGLYSE